MDMHEIKRLCKDETIEASSHFIERGRRRNISYKETKEAIISGEIIEDYPNDYPFPSCLVLGKTYEGKVLHVVVGIGKETLWLITVYEPDRNRWDSDYKTRREL